MLTAARIPKRTQGLRACVPLIPVELDDPKKVDLITFDLCLQADDDDSNTYKKTCRKFSHGEPDEWISTLQDFEEIFRQNDVDEPVRRMTIIKTIIRGEAQTMFDATVALDDMADVDVELTNELVDNALAAVSVVVFPHRAVTDQKRYMKTRQRLIEGTSFRKFSALLTVQNDKIPYFPEGDLNPKFTNGELIENMEQGLPNWMKSALDLKGFIPEDHSKAELIQEIEQLERNAPEKKETEKKSKNSEKGKSQKGKKSTNRDSNQRPSSGDKKTYYCSLHGVSTNPNHTTDSCFTLKKQREDAKNGGKGKKSYTPREMHALSKIKSKRKAIELFSTMYDKNQPKKKAKKGTKKSRAKAKKKSKYDSSDSDDSSESSKSSSDSDDDDDSSDESVHVLDMDDDTSEPTRIGRAARVMNRAHVATKTVAATQKLNVKFAKRVALQQKTHWSPGPGALAVSHLKPKVASVTVDTAKDVDPTVNDEKEERELEKLDDDPDYGVKEAANDAVSLMPNPGDMFGNVLTEDEKNENRVFIKNYLDTMPVYKPDSAESDTNVFEAQKAQLLKEITGWDVIKQKEMSKK
jgi:hypothetical protein